MAPIPLVSYVERILANRANILLGLLGILPLALITFHSQDVLRDRIQASKDTEDTFDFIIVGAGSAGCVLANRLSEDHKVLVLDAGGEPNPLHSIPLLSIPLSNHPEADWQYLTTPQNKSCLAMKNRQCAWPRGKSLGGSSNLNYMIYIRGHPKDFDNWANITGDARWSYENVLPYFKKSEDYTGEWDTPKYHAHGGNLKVGLPHYTGLADTFVRAAEEFGYPKVDLNAEFTEGVSPIYSTIHQGNREGTYKAFLQPVRNRRNLFIYKFAHVTQVLLKGTENRAYGVEYVRHGVKRLAFAAKEVILSAGAINSPQILMLSGIGPRDHLESLGIPVKVDLPVGNNLQDHISSLTGPFLVDSPITMQIGRDITPSTIRDFFQFGEGPLTSTGFQANAFLTTKYAREGKHPDWPDIQFMLLGIGFDDIIDRVGSRALNLKAGVLRKVEIDGGGFKDSFHIVNSLCRPLSRGTLRLQSRDPLQPPLLDPNYFDVDRDLQTIIEGAKRAVEIVENSTTFRSVNARLHPDPHPLCKHFRFRSDPYWECYHRHVSLTVYHPSGTCAMGKRDSPFAVVDTELRVLGVKHLRVIDTSIMPNLTSGNTNAPTIMIAEMGSSLIKSYWSDVNTLET